MSFYDDDDDDLPPAFNDDVAIVYSGDEEEIFSDGNDFKGAEEEDDDKNDESDGDFGDDGDFDDDGILPPMFGGGPVIPVSASQDLLEGENVLPPPEKFVVVPNTQHAMSLETMEEPEPSDETGGITRRISSGVDYQHQFDVFCLVALPLLTAKDNGVPVPPLRTQDEIDAIWQTLGNSRFPVKVQQDVATLNNLSKALGRRTRILHYTGHGEKRHLVFEDQDVSGVSRPVGPKALAELVRMHGAQLDLVVVSACHSEAAGKAFASAGARHVICVKLEETMLDKIATFFTRAFYSQLIDGSSVKGAFDYARQSILTAFDDPIQRPQAKKFLLLPQNADHSEVLYGPSISRFGTMAGGLAPPGGADSLPAATTMTIQRSGSGTTTASGASSSTIVQNFTAAKCHKILPYPPSIWHGRYKKLVKIMGYLRHPDVRLTILKGEKGCGKTSFICKAAHYLRDRYLFDGVYMFDTRRLLERVKGQSLAGLILASIHQAQRHRMRTTEINPFKGTMTGGDLPPESQGMGGTLPPMSTIQRLLTTTDDDTSRLISELSSWKQRVLLIFENIDYYQPSGLDSDRRIDHFISDLVKNCHKVVVCATMGASMRGAPFSEHFSQMLSNKMDLGNFTKEEANEFFFDRLSRKSGHFKMRMIEKDIPTITETLCRRNPLLILEAVSLYGQLLDSSIDHARSTRKRAIRMKLQEKRDSMQKWRYFRPLGDSELKKWLRDPDILQWWTETFGGHRQNAHWRQIGAHIRDYFLEKVGEDGFRCRQFLIEHHGFRAHGFIMTLFKTIAKEQGIRITFPESKCNEDDLPSKPVKKPRNPVVPKVSLGMVIARLLCCGTRATRGISSPPPVIAHSKGSGTGGKSRSLPGTTSEPLKDFPDKPHEMPPRVVSLGPSLRTGDDTISGEKIKQAESLLEDEQNFLIPVKVFGPFWEFFTNLMDMLLEPAISRHFFTSDPTILEGFITREDSEKILRDPDIPLGTCLFRFSGTHSRSFVIVLKREKRDNRKRSSDPSKHKKKIQIAHVRVNVDTSTKTCFVVSVTGLVRSPTVSSLYDLVKQCESIKHLWTSSEVIPRDSLLSILEKQCRSSRRR